MKRYGKRFVSYEILMWLKLWYSTANPLQRSRCAKIGLLVK